MISSELEQINLKQLRPEQSEHPEQTEQPSQPFVSVIIPVYNDAKRLKLCLDALERQTYPSDRYEVIVVDNGSDPQENIPDVVAEFPQAIASFEAALGSFAARNRGIALARGEVIAFTDADCIPATNWLEAGVRQLLDTPNCGLVAGRVDVFFQNPQQATPVELYEFMTAFPQKELVERHRYAATANVFTYKVVIDRAGVFDPALKSSGDIEWGQRIAASGYQLVYADDARIAHPARYSFRQLYKRSIRLAGGIYDLYNRQCYSFLQRNWLYLISLLEHLVPPVNFVVNTFASSQLSTLQQKLQVSLVMVFVRYVSAFELVRLKLGGVSTRD